MWLQIVVALLALFAVLRIIQNYRTSNLSGSASFFWFLIWIVVAVIFWFPDIASRLALTVGIGRGADLITYSAILVLVYLVYRLFVRLERLEHTITTLTRTITLRDASSKDSHTDSHR
jgi:hypothetical protein